MSSSQHKKSMPSRSRFDSVHLCVDRWPLHVTCTRVFDFRLVVPPPVPTKHSTQSDIIDAQPLVALESDERFASTSINGTVLVYLYVSQCGLFQ